MCGPCAKDGPGYRRIDERPGNISGGIELRGAERGADRDGGGRRPRDHGCAFRNCERAAYGATTSRVGRLKFYVSRLRSFDGNVAHPGISDGAARDRCRTGTRGDCKCNGQTRTTRGAKRAGNRTHRGAPGTSEGYRLEALYHRQILDAGSCNDRSAVGDFNIVVAVVVACNSGGRGCVSIIIGSNLGVGWSRILSVPLVVQYGRPNSGDLECGGSSRCDADRSFEDREVRGVGSHRATYKNGVGTAICPVQESNRVA